MSTSDAGSDATRQEDTGSSKFNLTPPNAAYDNPVMVNKSEREVDEIEGGDGTSSRRASRIAEFFGLGKSGDVSGKPNSVELRRPSETNIGRRNSRLSIIFADFFRDSVFDRSSAQWLHYSNEAAPRLENYRNSSSLFTSKSRPTLDELHYEEDDGQPRRFSTVQEIPLKSGAVKFGWIRGVLIRCLLNIWGVMLFLRMGWMTGQAGIILSIVIVALSTVVTVTTTLSMSAICTNGEIKGGGAYFLISRNLGPEFGGAVGIIFSFANAVAASMYIIGAAETVRDLLLTYDLGIVEYPSGINDVRVSGIVLLLLMMCVTAIGMAFENKTQIILLLLLLVALMDYFVGSCLPPSDAQKAKGFVGWNWNVGVENMKPDFRKEQFFTVFAVFFPSVTGILAGANISGDLKDPSSALPKGTLWSIIISTVTYVVIIIWLGFTTVRDATGNVADLANDTFLNCANRKCPHGLMNYNQVMEMASAYGPLIYAGIFAATLSSALAALISAPRIFQAFCRDNIFSYLKFFAKGYGANDDPRRAAVLVFIIALLFTIIAELNAIAPIISNFFMATYGLVNISCFHASYVESPGFRPSFKYYNKWLSLLGGVLCITVMFIMNWVTALVTFAVVVAFCVYINKAGPDINWGTATQGYHYKNAILSVLKLNTVEEHVRNYRPAIMVLTGNPGSRAPLVDFGDYLTKKVGLLVCGHVVKRQLSWQERTRLNTINNAWLVKRGAKGFYCVVDSSSMTEGMHYMLQSVGFGKLKPNILLMGYMKSWQECDRNDLHDYFRVIHEAFDMHISLAILKLPTKMNFSQYFETEEGFPIFEEKDFRKQGTGGNATLHKDSIINLETVAEEPTVAIITTPPTPDGEPVYAVGDPIKQMKSEVNKQTGRQEIPADVMSEYDYFLQKQKKGTIDVWWLYDDGGLTLLLPYLLTIRAKWRNCKLRVFAVALKEDDISQEQVNMAALLHKFRIQYSDVLVLSTSHVQPSEESQKSFQKMTSKWMTSEDTAKGQMSITKDDLVAYKKKTNSHLCLREFLVQHSKDAALIVMTLPLPKKDSCPAPLYMAWLEILTNGMPPFLFVRGNQSSVLTFYS